MKRSAAVFVIVVTLALAAGSAMLWGASSGGAATPTPKATATGTPVATATATPLPPNALRLRIVNDLNGNGRADPDEPGIGGWQVDAGCSDGRFVLTTDDQGYFVDRSLPADSPDSVSCYHVERPFGWLPTGRVINFRISAGSTPYPFTFRDLGRNVMEMSGEFIVSGLPAALGDPGVAKPHRDCGHSFLIFYTESEVQAAVIVDGADSQTGCFAPGDLVTPGDTGAPAGVPIPFEPGTSVGTTFLSGEDSMRFHATDVSSASVLDIGAGRLTENCAVVIPVDGFVPPGYARVFILPEKYRPGCGASGRLVRLYRDREPLEPTFEWRAGSTEMGPFLLAPANVVRPPDTGSAGLVPGSHRGAGD